MDRGKNRRQFLKHLGAAGVAATAMRVRPSLARTRPASERLNLAMIGCGGRGLDNLKEVAGENIVALCDVDDPQAAQAFEMYPKARRFRDYRRLLDRMHGEIDAVVVSTPDHMHAPISLAAM
jgi:predicted dehydrogenase